MDIGYIVFNLKNYVSTYTIYTIISYFYRDLSSVAPLASDINRFCTSDNFLYQFIISYGILLLYANVELRLSLCFRSIATNVPIKIYKARCEK